ncbi:hypothetical protein MILUP08_42674 [Micromonospora lupini str. Lupac 08]|uniref:Uncharacterized protein n=1 Tax=Micromonospora lupini str. Lupac 08 TaxID=1150864 RepID=I0L1P6_9ACTN|nr:hypothetical protein MILUP08_42674 [Micromonospora lupini str. Lupac 08]
MVGPLMDVPTGLTSRPTPRGTLSPPDEAGRFSTIRMVVRCGGRMGAGLTCRPLIVTLRIDGRRELHCCVRLRGSGSPLCQEAAARVVLGWGVAGPGSDFSEELAWGCELVKLESVVVSRCPPGPVAVAVVAWSVICR